MFVAFIAIQTGSFANIILQITKMAELSVSTAFLTVMLMLSMLSVVMSWIGSFSASAGEAQIQAAEFAYGAAQRKTMEALAAVLSKDQDSPPGAP